MYFFFLRLFGYCSSWFYPPTSNFRSMESVVRIWRPVYLVWYHTRYRCLFRMYPRAQAGSIVYLQRLMISLVRLSNRLFILPRCCQSGRVANFRAHIFCLIGGGGLNYSHLAPSLSFINKKKISLDWWTDTPPVKSTGVVFILEVEKTRERAKVDTRTQRPGKHNQGDLTA